MSSRLSDAALAELMRHTPGPWRWTDGDDDVDIRTYKSPGYYNNPQLRAPADQDVIGCSEYWIIDGEGKDEQTANALLIAAAPSLLSEVTEMRALVKELAHMIVELVTYSDVPDVQKDSMWRDLRSRGADLLSRARKVSDDKA